MSRVLYGPFREGKNLAHWATELLGMVKRLTPLIDTLGKESDQMIALKGAVKPKTK